VLSGTALAQIPRGSVIMSQFANLPPMEGLLLVTRGGIVTPVTGLAANPRGADVNAIKLDPIDNRVWVGGINALSSGRLHYLTIAGSTVAGVTQHGPMLNPGSISGIAFDVNCNPVVSTNTLNATSTTTGVFRIHRTTGVATQIAGGPINGWPFQPGVANAVCSDPRGNIYFCANGAATGGPIYSLAAPNYATPVMEGWCVPPSSILTIGGLTWAPDTASPRGAIWWAMLDPVTIVGKLVLSATPPVAGVAVITNPPSTSPYNWIEYDND
jgi:hypothetical protein